ncbi:MAG: UDP-N-acetylmuramate:L-alanyl-gamma-D-glutamyl-meso-diaminopimelate ligase [Acidimicrobiia bacterium]|nr:UDP-N-acetylmuramate:L-alanyl-gamma-D-glutamyl-meso-diaminopimelate ligase [Acidimicrobiia bacterium]
MRVHLIGICGTAMATLAALLKGRGHEVRGSDQHIYPPMSDFLVREGIRLLDGYRPEHVADDPDLVVIGNAVSRGNPEVEEVLARKIRYASLPDVLRNEFLWQARSIVVAGTHGKTTTTALTGWLLTAIGRDPTVFLGGIALNFGEAGSSYRRGAGRDVVLEGDEYDSAFFDKTAKFLKYVPDVAIVGNVEFDHADIYADMDAVRLAFRRLVNLVPRNGLLLLGADSPEAAALAAASVSPTETFGLSRDADWRASDVSTTNGETRFVVRRKGTVFGEFTMPLLGAHNVRNALAAVAAGAFCGAGPGELAAALGRFAGVKRRLEVVGQARHVTVIDDFAHHPTAVRETLAALRGGFPGQKIWAVFEPRSASSCRRVFQDEFAAAFPAADEVVVAAVYRSALPEGERLSAEQLVADLVRRGQRARYIPGVDEIVRTVAGEAGDGDLVLVMSNGGFGGIHRRLLAALG